MSSSCVAASTASPLCQHFVHTALLALLSDLSRALTLDAGFLEKKNHSFLTYFYLPFFVIATRKGIGGKVSFSAR